MDKKMARLIDLVEQLNEVIINQKKFAAEKLEIETELIDLLEHPQDKTKTYEVGSRKLTISSNRKSEWDQGTIVDWSRERPELLNYFKTIYSPDNDAIKKAREEGKEIIQYIAECQKISFGKPSFKVGG